LPIPGLSAFPNPAPQMLTLQLEEQNASLDVQVYSAAAGQLVYATTWNAGNSSISIPFSNLASGVYVVRVASTERMSHLKIIKQ
jgi:hypothetical protein